MIHKIALRVHELPKELTSTEFQPKPMTPYGGELIFDCETTSDELQNLKFGSYQYRIRGIAQEVGIFYEPTEVSPEELAYLQKSSEKNRMILVTREEFMKKFIDYVLNKHAICIGHNLAFDISRICIGVSYCRGHYKGGFSLKLSKNKAIPRIKTLRINEKKILLRFGSILGVKNFGGHFLDTQILASAVLDEKHLSLDELAKKLGIQERKLAIIEHGKITPEYIDYNLRDVQLTNECFQKLKEKYNEFGLKLPITKAISGASVGKQFLRKMGIKSFAKQNPDFPSEVLGWCMSAFYGGRCEVRMRKTPVRVTVLDFTSMYPTICHNMKMQRYVIADKTEMRKVDVTKLLNDITLEQLYSPAIWSSLCIICKIKPSEDCLPIRSDYDGKTLNVGINYLTSDESLYYFLPDLVYSKLITGKIPQIEEAWEFISVGVQESIKPVEIFGISVDPRKQDVIRELVIQRNRLKKVNEAQSQGLKILANATSYGIFIELNPEKEVSDLAVYAQKTFNVKGFHEKPGEYFNPIIGGLIVSGSRLLLGMVELELARKAKSYYACDTDSMFVPPHVADDIRQKFQSLSPYEESIDLLKKEFENVWFYGVSSKRYVLYEKEGNSIRILEQKGKRGYKLHGLGYILNPFGSGIDWHKQFWEDGLKLHYGIVSEAEINEKYRHYYCLSRLTVSSWDTYSRFRHYNKGKPFRERIKPFNFFLLGFGNESDVRPLASYTKNFQEAVHKPFIDYKTSRVMEGIEHWQNLAGVFTSYFNHSESKMDGDTGLLKRRHITSNTIIYIGKEGRDLDTQIMRKPSLSTYTPKEVLLERIAKMTEKDAKLLHIPRSTFYRLKNGLPKLRNKTLRRLS